MIDVVPYVKCFASFSAGALALAPEYNQAAP